MTELSWRDQDVYFWRYKKSSESVSYHCTCGMAIVRGEYLMDIYWGMNPGADGRRWTKETAIAYLELEYKGNLDDYEQIAAYKTIYYKSDDILNLSHSNSSGSQVFLRKGAQRDRDTILAAIRYQREEAESKIDSAISRLKTLREVEQQILDGEPLEDIWL